MSITVGKGKGVTVITVSSDSQSMLPPLCQILKGLCYSPMCCSVYKGMMQTNVVAALGTVQIMVGLFNIGLGPGRTSTHPYDVSDLGVAYWLGGVFIAAGIVAFLAGLFPSVCSVGFTVFVNIVGSIVAIIGIVLYAIDVGDAAVTRMCDWSSYSADNYDNNCRDVAYFAQRLLTAMDITLIVLAALQLCVCINLAILGIKALLNRKKGGRDVEYQPVEVLMTSPGA